MTVFPAWTRRGIVRYIAREWKRPWRRIIVHHTYKPTIANFNEHPDGSYWCKVIDRFHKSKGWKGIGYHFVIAPDGLIYIGRDLNTPGAHTAGQNHVAIGVCLLGNFDDEEMTTEQRISLKYLLAFLLHRFNLGSDDIFFHRNFANKTCPGIKLNLATIRQQVEATLPNAIGRYTQILQDRRDVA